MARTACRVKISCPRSSARRRAARSGPRAVTSARPAFRPSNQPTAPPAAAAAQATTMTELMSRPCRAAKIAAAMSAEVIVSYDGTENDEDAVALGNLLAATGARLALAYVRHAHDWDTDRELIAQHDAERLLERGALGLENPEVDRHIVFDASTP